MISLMQLTTDHKKWPCLRGGVELWILITLPLPQEPVTRGKTGTAGRRGKVRCIRTATVRPSQNSKSIAIEQGATPGRGGGAALVSLLSTQTMSVQTWVRKTKPESDYSTDREFLAIGLIANKCLHSNMYLTVTLGSQWPNTGWFEWFGEISTKRQIWHGGGPTKENWPAKSILYNLKINKHLKCM